MKQFSRIAHNPKVMGGKPCIRGMRVTVGMIAGQIRAGVTVDELPADYCYLEREDILEAIEYADIYLRPLPCPCCEQATLSSRDDYEICEVCNWEDDPSLRANPEKPGSDDMPSLNKARMIVANGGKLPMPPKFRVIV
jgi:uncharacterized protein (DUF433 family)